MPISSGIGSTENRFDELLVFRLVDGHTVQLAVLIRDDQPPFVIDGHRHPGALLGFGHAVKAFDLEPVGNADLVGGR